MENEQHNSSISAALSSAYQAITALGFTHKQIVDENPIVINYKILRRIREGKPGRAFTNWIYLRHFLSMLNKEYNSRLSAGGDGANEILRIMQQITLILFEISPSKPPR